jgi:hypothetical protein
VVITDVYVPTVVVFLNPLIWMLTKVPNGTDAGVVTVYVTRVPLNVGVPLPRPVTVPTFSVVLLVPLGTVIVTLLRIWVEAVVKL